MNTLSDIIKDIAVPGRGILAADESSGTIKKRFDIIGLESNEENRRAYRELLFTAKDIEKYISGVILYEETLMQKCSCGKPFPVALQEKGIVPGIKVDLGLVDFASGCCGLEKITEGIDGLEKRLEECAKHGARFAKWRAVYSIQKGECCSSEKGKCCLPSKIAIKSNNELLSRYAKICQKVGIVPIVEPEVLMDGNHDIETSYKVTTNVLHAVFHSLYKHGVEFNNMVLKPSMVIHGSDCKDKASIEEVAKKTVKSLMNTVPSAVPCVFFLSGGQTEQDATSHLNAMNKLECKYCCCNVKTPWYLSFSYGRALQDSCIKTWGGKKENIEIAQETFIKRARLNGLASLGQYSEEMEKDSK